MASLSTIYFLKCPIDNKIRYIGRTEQPLKIRLGQHMSNVYYESSKDKRNWISKLKKKGLKAIIVPIETVNKEDAKSTEFKWIRLLRDNNIRLYNSKHFHYICQP